MTTTTTIRSPGAMVLGLVMATVTAYVLFEDVLHGAALTTTHVTSAATLLATIAAGHLLWPQIKRGNIIGALGLAVVFIGGTVYVVTMSGARNAETAAAKISATANANAERSRVLELREKAQAMLEEATRKMAAECATGKGKRCDGTKATVDVYTAALKGHDADLAKLGPEKPANAYAHAAKVFAAIPGVTVATDDIERRLGLLMPYVLVTVVEMATLTFLGLALGHKEAVPTNAPGLLAPNTLPETSPGTSEPPKGKRGGRPAHADVVAFSEAFIRRSGRAPTGSEIRSQFPELAASTAYDHAARARARVAAPARLRVVA